MSAREQGRVHDEPAPSRSEGREGERAGAVARPAGESDRAARLAAITDWLYGYRSPEMCDIVIDDEECTRITVTHAHWLLDEVRALQAQLDAAREDAARWEVVRELYDGVDFHYGHPQRSIIAIELPIGVFASGCVDDMADQIRAMWRSENGDDDAIDAARAAAAPRGEEGAHA